MLSETGQLAGGCNLQESSYETQSDKTIGEEDRSIPLVTKG